MNKILTYTAYTIIGLLALIAGVGILKVLIYLGVMLLGFMFNQPLIAFIIALAGTVLLFLIPDRK